eukprot:scaffold161988_cov34-Tisochrysis_lutea.AAC.9
MSSSSIRSESLSASSAMPCDLRSASALLVSWSCSSGEARIDAARRLARREREVSASEDEDAVGEALISMATPSLGCEVMRLRAARERGGGGGERRWGAK